jgi:hypothetical protein
MEKGNKREELRYEREGNYMNKGIRNKWREKTIKISIEKDETSKMQKIKHENHHQ